MSSVGRSHRSAQISFLRPEKKHKGNGPKPTPSEISERHERELSIPVIRRNS